MSAHEAAQKPRGALAKIEAILTPHLTPQTQSAERRRGGVKSHHHAWVRSAT
jgi:hypothetical protein